MNIYLMRHGHALSKGEDADRPLSKQGIREVRAGARAMKRMGVSLDAIVVSPKARSRQTGEIAADILGYSRNALLETDAVKPLAPASAAIEYLAGLEDKDRILVTGHLPSLPAVAAALVGDEGREAPIALATGGLCRIDIDMLPSCQGTVVWLLTPEQLALIAGR